MRMKFLVDIFNTHMRVDFFFLYIKLITSENKYTV